MVLDGVARGSPNNCVCPNHHFYPSDQLHRESTESLGCLPDIVVSGRK